MRRGIAFANHPVRETILEGLEARTAIQKARSVVSHEPSRAGDDPRRSQRTQRLARTGHQKATVVLSHEISRAELRVLAVGELSFRPRQPARTGIVTVFAVLRSHPVRED